MNDQSEEREDQGGEPQAGGPHPMPASLLQIEPGGEGPGPNLASKLSTFCFAALLMRVSDAGSVTMDVISGWNTGINQEHAQDEFVRAVRAQYPQLSITKVVGDMIPAE